jgi:hypothetical protein
LVVEVEKNRMIRNLCLCTGKLSYRDPHPDSTLSSAYEECSEEKGEKRKKTFRERKKSILHSKPLQIFENDILLSASLRVEATVHILEIILAWISVLNTYLIIPKRLLLPSSLQIIKKVYPSNTYPKKLLIQHLEFFHLKRSAEGSFHRINSTLHPLLRPTQRPHLNRITQSIILILHIIDNLQILIDRGRDQRLLGWEVGPKEGVDDECRGEPP